MALAGPAVNVVLAAALFGGIAMLGASPLAHASLWGDDLLTRLFWVNVSLAMFNLLPAFPMDGGRALRALLAMRIDRARATEFAARLGQGMALLLGAIGLVWQPLLVFIALFVWIGAEREAAASQLEGAIEGIGVERVMATDLRVLSPDAPLSEAVDAVLAGFQLDFPVVAGDGRVVGVLTREDLVRGLTASGPNGRIAEVMQGQGRYVAAEVGESVSTALRRLQGCGCRSMPVVRDGRLAGMLTMDNLGEYLLLQQATRSHFPNGAREAPSAA
ncbi:MAG: CBS domain-containing protein [Myxococcota bacterium]